MLYRYVGCMPGFYEGVMVRKQFIWSSKIGCVMIDGNRLKEWDKIDWMCVNEIQSQYEKIDFCLCKIVNQCSVLCTYINVKRNIDRFRY